MNPRLRHGLILAAAALIAAFCGWEIAGGSYFWPMLAGAIAVGAIVVRLTGMPLDVVVLGGVLFGYIAGNRGFAQLTPPYLPLFPAEAALLIAGGWRFAAWALERRLPAWRDAVTSLIVAWLLVGTVRFAFDVRSHGMMAVRDFATVYYASFYFIARDLGRDPASRAFLIRCLLAALAVLAVAGPLYDTFPEFFLRNLQVAGSPLLYFKGALLNAYLGIAAVMLFQFCPAHLQRWLLPVSAWLFAWVLFGGNRASAAALAVAAAALVAGGQRRFAAMHLGLALVVAIAVLGLATVGDNDWAEKRIHGVQDRVASVLDPQGNRTYASEDSANKGDNNRFRLIWWRNVLVETWYTNPVFGLGFGHDLAAGFVREYYPESSEDFATRSPHNIFVTVAGRLGGVGLAVWTLLAAAILHQLWRTLRLGDPRESALAVSVGMIFICSCFGVVLEGPMGAVPFWVLLGLVHRGREWED